MLVVLGANNLIRSPMGRAMVAIRDSEISAQSLGVNLVRYKTIAFAISAFITGLAGALLGHKLKFISPDAFNIILSIQLADGGGGGWARSTAPSLAQSSSVACRRPSP